MAEPADKVEETAETEGETKEPVAGEKAAETTKEESKAEASETDPDKYTPEERKKPWANREERAEFFKGKKNDGDKTETAAEEKNDTADIDINDLVDRKIEKVLSPLQQQLAAQADDQEVKDFLGTGANRDRFGKFEGLVRKAMKVYTNVPVGNLFKQFAFDDAERLGAEKADKARDKATRRGVTGTTTRKTDSGLPDFKTMSPKEIDEFNKRVRKGETFKVEEGD